jgi:hypothetical protein
MLRFAVLGTEKAKYLPLPHYFTFSVCLFVNLTKICKKNTCSEYADHIIKVKNAEITYKKFKFPYFVILHISKLNTDVVYEKQEQSVLVSEEKNC